jgi:hypothetical protein
VRHAALGHDVAGTALAAAALGGHAKLELDVVKAQTGTHVARDIPVGNAMTDANNLLNVEPL